MINNFQHRIYFFVINRIDNKLAKHHHKLVYYCSVNYLHYKLQYLMATSFFIHIYNIRSDYIYK